MSQRRDERERIGPGSRFGMLKLSILRSFQSRL